VGKVFLGFTFLLSAFMPVGSYIFQLAISQTSREFIKSIPRIYWQLGIMLSTYLLSALIVMLFFKYSRLESRFNGSVPAQNAMLFGVIIISIYLIALAMASTVEGGGGAFTVLQFSPYIIWPARALLIYGAVTVLLAANPLTSSSSATAKAAR
jgi:hypothetical protein